VRAAVAAGLDAMIQTNVNVALVARVSCGLYAGKLTCDDPTCCPPPPRGVGRCRNDKYCGNRACRFYHPNKPCRQFQLGRCGLAQCHYVHSPCRQHASFRQRICAQYRTMVNELLAEGVMCTDRREYPRGRFFDLVVITLLQ
jgi:hypothetical protein